MTYSQDFLARFGKLSVLDQSCLIVLAAIAGADTLTLIFYGISSRTGFSLTSS